MIDIAIDDNLDLKFVDGELMSQDNDETTLLNALFTDARVNDARGYWLDLILSEAWTFEQARLNNTTRNNLIEVIKGVANDLINAGVFKKIDVGVDVVNRNLELTLRCYSNENEITIDKTFII